MERKDIYELIVYGKNGTEIRISSYRTRSYIVSLTSVREGFFNLIYPDKSFDVTNTIPYEIDKKKSTGHRKLGVLVTTFK